MLESYCQLHELAERSTQLLALVRKDFSGEKRYFSSTCKMLWRGSRSYCSALTSGLTVILLFMCMHTIKGFDGL